MWLLDYGQRELVELEVPEVDFTWVEEFVSAVRVPARAVEPRTPFVVVPPPDDSPEYLDIPEWLAKYR